MNKKAILTVLTVAVIFAASACGTTITTPPGTIEPPTTEAPVEYPTPEAPSIPTEDKPSLEFSGPIGNARDNVQQIIAFTFPSASPDWTIPIKAVPYKELKLNPGGFTSVSMLEIGSGSKSGVPEPGIYDVAINLDTGEGQLASIKSSQTYPVVFQRIAQILNPARGKEANIDQFQNLKPPSDLSAAISSDGVCFVVKVDDKPTYVRFCSKPTAPSDEDALLSVMDNFPSQYKNLQDSIDTVTNQLKDKGLFDQEAVFQLDQIISEMEHPQHLEGCVKNSGQDAEAVKAACGSDIMVAPAQADYYHKKFDDAKRKSALPSGRWMIMSVLDSLFQQGNSFSVPVAAVQVIQQIETPNGPIRPGNYRMDYWYQVINGKDVFYAATITGITNTGGQVTNQPVPAVPATFINENSSDPEQPGAQISVCRIFGICTFFQSSCS